MGPHHRVPVWMTELLTEGADRGSERAVTTGQWVVLGDVLYEKVLHDELGFMMWMRSRQRHLKKKQDRTGTSGVEGTEKGDGEESVRQRAGKGSPEMECSTEGAALGLASHDREEETGVPRWGKTVAMMG
ncbi:hypothetical protein PG985_005943 [Apiospora marii]|uniref:DNA replication complex GINS protein PSF3 n=1 Tax=Apiospora marii TaxID=335849 RepID=A0ABR1SC36_9PEZI